MATVKGDVHDIGKNIVGVVLQCNNYEVIDLGVMVPAQKILDAAQGARRRHHRAVRADHARRSTRWSTSPPRWSARASTIPLLIGGATTSRAHTAVKVDQKYDGPVVWVKDASRSVPTVAALLSDERRPTLLAEVDGRLRRRCGSATRAKRRAGRCCRSPTARAHAHPDRLDRLPPAAPAHAAAAGAATCTRSAGDRRAPRSTQFVKTFHDYPLGELRELHRLAAVLQRVGDEGPVPRHPQQPGQSGEAARRLYEDAQAMLDQLIAEKWLRANGVVRPVPGQLGRRRRHRGLHRRARAEPCATTLHHAAPADRAPRRASRTGRWPTSSHPRGPAARLRRGVRGDGRARRRRAGRRVQGRPRRLQRDPARVAGRPAGRGLRRAAARAGPQRVLGLRARRAPRQRRADRGAVRRHPAGARLPGLPGAHREADALATCSTSRPTPASRSPRAWRCGRARR